MSLILISAPTNSVWQHRVPALPATEHTFRIFSDPDRVLFAARESSPAAVILAADVLTPAHLALLRHLAHTRPGLPILIAADNPSPETVMRCARAGATHFFAEPYTNPELLARLKQAILDEAKRCAQNAQDNAGLLQPHQTKTLRRVIQEHLTSTLEACHGNRTQTAKLLGIDRSTLRRRLGETESHSPA